MQNLKISQKLFGGFFIVLAVLALAVGTSIWGIKGLQDTPLMPSNQQMMNNINASLAALLDADRRPSKNNGPPFGRI